MTANHLFAIMHSTEIIAIKFEVGDKKYLNSCTNFAYDAV